MLKFAVKRKASDIFHEAILTKDAVRVKSFLMNNNQQFNVDELDSDGLTALQRSCFTGNMKLVQLLVMYGANLLIQDKEGWTLLHAASVAGNNAIVRYLVSMGADVSVKNDQGDMAIDLAADLETVIILADAMQKLGMTAELEAFFKQKPEVKKNLNDKLHEQREALLDRPRSVSAPVHLFSEKELYASHVISENAFPWNEFLMSEGSGRFITKNTTSTQGSLSVISPNVSNNRPVLTRLENAGKPRQIYNGNNIHTTHKGKALCAKCEKRNLEKDKRLSIASDTSLSSDSLSSTDSAYFSTNSVSSGCGMPSSSTSSESLALSEAETLVFEAVLDKGIMPERGRSRSLISTRHKPILNAVSQSHTPHSSARRAFSSPSKLGHSAKTNDSKFSNIEEMMANIENMNELNENGMSMLHEASADGDTQTVAFLLNSGAEVNRQSLEGSTPLHEAAKSGSLTCTLMLIDAGADLFAETDSGLLPIDQARNRDTSHLIERAMTIR